MITGRLSNLFTSAIKSHSSDLLLIAEIKLNNQKTIANLYNHNKDKVKKLVWSFKNLSLDADDIYQEGFTFAIFNIQEGKFRSDSSFSTYLFSICKNLCLKQLSKNRTMELTDRYDVIEDIREYDLLNELIKYKLELGDKCREILDLRFAMGNSVSHAAPNKCLSFEDIATELDITQVSARQRFKRCLDKLREFVLASPELKQYISK
jgi:RNA polymerase sigma factor (sigma-70 family)